MKKWALIVDVASCTNCQNCVLATQDEHVGNDYPGYTAAMPEEGAAWIRVQRHTRGNDAMVDVTYVPVTCQQCERAPCMDSAEDGSVYRRADGIVVIDPVKARGRRDLVDACPYGAITWNATQGVPQKWMFDAHLLDAGWSAPRCVQACPTGALQALQLADAELERIRTEQGLEPLVSGSETRPRVLYRNLRTVRHRFLGGTVTHRTGDGTVDNVADATVELLIAGESAAVARTDAFGDFKLDGLPDAPVAWLLRVGHPSFGSASLSGTLDSSRYLGAVLLE